MAWQRLCSGVAVAWQWRGSCVAEAGQRSGRGMAAEGRSVGEYSRSGVGVDSVQQVIAFDEDF